MSSKNLWRSRLPESRGSARSRAGLESERDRPVVDELDLHPRAEPTGADVEIEGSHRVDEALVELLGERGLRRVVERRTVTRATVGGERELADDEDRSSDVDRRTIHLPGVVGEETEARDLLGEARR